MFDQQRDQLVRALQHTGYLKTDSVIQAFRQIPREKFLSDKLKNRAYIDSPLPIERGQTISAPHMIAIMCEALDLKSGQKILEIGTGSGYHAAITATIVGPSGHVYSIERFKQLVHQAKTNLKQANIDNATVKNGDGSQGLSEYQPYDRIYVTCAAPDIPQPLINQLNDPGKLVIPVGRMYCELKRFEKKNNKTTIDTLGGCVFVPLIGKHGFS